MKVKSIDLNNDWLNIVKEELTALEYHLSNLTDEKISILYFSLKKKLIPPKTRQIKKADVFSCPTNLQTGLQLVESKIINGEELKPHLTRNLKKLDDNDGLLFDWGIFHLHLGTEIDTDGFVKRTGSLLYARFDDSTAYFIGVFNHGAWTMQEMLKTIHKNWPESIEQHRIKGVLGVERNFQDSDIKQLRNAQINTLIEVDRGVIYMGPGGGISASGDSAESVMKHLDRKRGLERLEKSLKENTETLLRSLFQSLDFIKDPELEFKLVSENGKFQVYERNNDFYIILNN